MKALLCLLLLPFLPVAAQTTQGSIVGRVVSAYDGSPIAGAVITCRRVGVDQVVTVGSDAQGVYALTSLSPGVYRVRAEAPGYRAIERNDFELAVAARLEIEFAMQSLESAPARQSWAGIILPRTNALVPIFGPDLQTGRTSELDAFAVRANTAHTSQSYVIDPRQLAQLPLVTRNLYSLLITVPGVIAEDRTGRAIGIVAHGQRASSSSFLFDGGENNDYLNSGAFTSVNPETIQEYRITTAVPSAEFGGAAGYLANAVTRSGTLEYHGTAYGYLINEFFAANTWTNNASGRARQPYKQLHTGLSIGGPVWKERLLFSSSYEKFRSRSRTNPEDFVVPNLPGLERCAAAGAIAIAPAIRELLTAFPPPSQGLAGGVCTDLLSEHTTTRPVSFDRDLGLARLDYTSGGGSHRLMSRFLISRFHQPDFVFSVYPDSNSTLGRNTSGVAFSHLWQIGPTAANEVRGGTRGGRIRFTRPHRDIPAFQVLEPIGAGQAVEVNTPGSDQAWEIDSHESNAEISDSFTWHSGRNTATFGGGFLSRSPRVNFPVVADGRYEFSSFLEYVRNTPAALHIAIERQVPGITGPAELADPLHTYSNKQFFGFAQNSFRAAANLTVNFGVRYEHFGVLESTGRPDGAILLGDGASVGERLSGARITLENELAFRPYRADGNNWSGRFGMAYDVRGNGRIVLRAGGGVFYDRVFDNLLVNPRNRSVTASFCVNPSNPECAPPYSPGGSLLRSTSAIFLAAPLWPQPFLSAEERLVRRRFPEPLWIDAGLRSPYVQTWFAGLQQRLTRRLTLDVTHTGTLGRKLLTSDYVNRLCSVLCELAANGSPIRSQRFNQSLGDILYRSNSGSSSYAGLGVLARYAASFVTAQAAYTYSHSIDNQSDPLIGDMFDLAATYPEGPPQARQAATFTEQFNSRLDRGNSDFDIRHHAVLFAIWHPTGFRSPGWSRGLTRGWRLSQLVSMRSGFPYIRYANNHTTEVTFMSTGGVLIGNRANLVGSGNPTLPEPEARQGRFYLLNDSEIRSPTTNQIGTLGRNSLTGPGFWNIDLSVARTIRTRAISETAEFEIRADAFNALNHSNLVVATNGFADRAPRSGDAGFPAIGPLYQTPRRIQFQLKFSF